MAARTHVGYVLHALIDYSFPIEEEEMNIFLDKQEVTLTFQTAEKANSFFRSIPPLKRKDGVYDFIRPEGARQNLVIKNPTGEFLGISDILHRLSSVMRKTFDSSTIRNPRRITLGW